MTVRLNALDFSVTCNHLFTFGEEMATQHRCEVNASMLPARAPDRDRNVAPIARFKTWKPLGDEMGEIGPHFEDLLVVFKKLDHPLIKTRQGTEIRLPVRVR
jgi:hypothetical protein